MTTGIVERCVACSVLSNSCKITFYCIKC